MIDIPSNPAKQNIICIWYQEDLALNNLQWLICHKTKLNQTYILYIFASNNV